MTPTERLIEKLSEAGFEAKRINGTKGYWRSQDCYRWDANCTRMSDGAPVYLGSYSTITECSRRPLQIKAKDTRYPREYYVQPIKSKRRIG